MFIFSPIGLLEHCRSFINFNLQWILFGISYYSDLENRESLTSQMIAI